MSLIYKVKKIINSPYIDSNFFKFPWNGIEPIILNKYMGDFPLHFPNVLAKVSYDNENIYIIFHVDDRYIRAVAQNHQDNVWEDSCVEFFFTPGIEISKGYFNIEMNCCGKMLFHYQKKTRENSIIISENDYKKIRIDSSIKTNMVYPEITEPISWTVEYNVPFIILEKYCEVVKPEKNIVWLANFYKCADKCSHPHWLTWSNVNFPKPNFHMPNFFGRLIFD